MLLLQILLYLALFTGMVALSVRGGAVNGLYFYPKAVQERAFAIGLADRDDIARKKKRFMVLFQLVMLVALLLIVGVWNRADTFLTAYWQALLLLEVMNWYDGIVIDRLWVGHSKFWVLPGTEDLPFVKPWKQVLWERAVLTAVWAAAAAGAALLALLIF